jgi:hypothetical protein
MARQKPRPANGGRSLTIDEVARMGGEARAKSLTAEERSAISKKGARARWGPLRKRGRKVQIDTRAYWDGYTAGVVLGYRWGMAEHGHHAMPEAYEKNEFSPVAI